MIIIITQEELFKMKKKSSFTIFYAPYSQKINDTFNEKFKRYIEDNKNTISIGNTTFYKAFEIIQLGKSITLAALNSQMNLKINDVIIDNHGNKYIIDGIEMIRMQSSTFPDWYKILTYVKIKGNFDNIGEYFVDYQVNPKKYHLYEINRKKTRKQRKTR